MASFKRDDVPMKNSTPEKLLTLDDIRIGLVVRSPITEFTYTIESLPRGDLIDMLDDEVGALNTSSIEYMLDRGYTVVRSEVEAAKSVSYPRRTKRLR